MITERQFEALLRRVPVEYRDEILAMLRSMRRQALTRTKSNR
jgi:hypothetical protein